MRLCDVVVIVM